MKRGEAIVVAAVTHTRTYIHIHIHKQRAEQSRVDDVRDCYEERRSSSSINSNSDCG